MNAHRLLAFVFAAASVLPLGAQARGATPAGSDSERTAALQAYDAGRVAEARPALEKLAPRYPHDFAVQEALGLAQAEAGETEAALPHLLAAATARSQDGPAQANLGAAYLQLHRLPEAVRWLTQAVSLDPRNAGAQADLGHALFLNGQPGPAAQALQAASRLRPEDAELRYDWVLALDTSHQSKAALAVLGGTLPGQQTAALHSLWGDVAEHAGLFQQAVQHMQLAAQRDPSEPNLYALAVELLRHWTWQPAEQVADFGLTRYPGSERLRFAKGVSLYGNTHFAEAADVFAGLVQAAPQNNTYGDLLGRSCSALGGTQSANCAALIGFAEQHPDNARVGVYAAISILHRPEDEQDLGKAEALLRQSLARDPGSADAWYQLGVLQQQRQQWAESETSLQKAIALRPAYAEAHYRLSRAYAHTGQRERASEELALQKQYAQQQKEASDAQLKEVTVFLTDTH